MGLCTRGYLSIVPTVALREQEGGTAAGVGGNKQKKSTFSSKANFYSSGRKRDRNTYRD
jgi:hypothetical protein